MRYLHRLGVIVALLFALLPQLALAHAQLHATDPAEGEVVDIMPEMVTLSFTEEISPLVLRWVAPDGSTTDIEGHAAGKTLSVIPPTGAERGSHILSWRIVSGDGHPVGGTLTFHLGEASARQDAAQADNPTGIGTVLARFLLSVALVTVVGAAVHATLISRAAPEPLLRGIGLTAGAATFLFAAAFLGFYGLDLTAQPLATLLTAPLPWQAAIGSSLATTALLSGVAAVLACMALVSSRPVALPMALLGWGIAAISYAVSGHAVVAPPAWLSTMAVVVHALAMIYWTGALLPLLFSLRKPDALVRLQRFSTLAIGMVLALLASGVVLVAVQVGDMAALIGSDYSKVLAAKLVLVAGLLVLATLNRLRLTPAMAAGKPGAETRMARSIKIEILLALLILVLAAMFRLTPPPRALMAAAPPAYVHLHSEKAMADVTLAPGRTGPVETVIAIQSGAFTELVPRAVDIAFAPVDGTLEPIQKSASLTEDGLWRIEPVTLPLAGDWEVTLRILITDFESVLLTETVTITR